ncbi:hypothetical protein AMTR_s00038p00061290 [Amborella trichopoda]|uniref:Uncharacterized protein n=1 Tax=Amborella trichopoda TaxID=13333 RepID=U5CWL5_AMBTC|nr:hypothetical protein AMTR_s00038p00061290 [Amborella trichopoda]
MFETNHSDILNHSPHLNAYANLALLGQILPWWDQRHQNVGQGRQIRNHLTWSIFNREGSSATPMAAKSLPTPEDKATRAPWSQKESLQHAETTC